MPPGAEQPIFFQVLMTAATFILIYILLLHPQADSAQKPGMLVLAGFILTADAMLTYYGARLIAGFVEIEPFQYATAGVLFFIATVGSFIIGTNAAFYLVLLVLSGIGVLVGLFAGIGLDHVTGEVLEESIFLYLGLAILVSLMILIFFRLYRPSQ